MSVMHTLTKLSSLCLFMAVAAVASAQTPAQPAPTPAPAKTAKPSARPKPAPVRANDKTETSTAAASAPPPSAAAPSTPTPSAAAEVKPACSLVEAEQPRGGRLEVVGENFGASPVVRIAGKPARMIERRPERLSVQIPADSNGGAITLLHDGRSSVCGTLVIIGKNR